MLGCATVEEVPVEYGELLSEEMGLISRRTDDKSPKRCRCTAAA